MTLPLCVFVPQMLHYNKRLVYKARLARQGSIRTLCKLVDSPLRELRSKRRACGPLAERISRLLSRLGRIRSPVSNASPAIRRTKVIPSADISRSKANVPLAPPLPSYGQRNHIRYISR